MTDKERRGLLGSAYIVLSIMTKIGKDDYELLTGHNLLLRRDVLWATSASSSYPGPCTTQKI